MRHFLFFSAILLFSFFSQAQVADWLRSIGGSGADEAFDVATDASGNVYTTGYFSDTVDFDPGPATFTLASAGDRDIFISKLDASGNFVWARRFGGELADFGIGITTDAAGNVIACGEFRDTVDFDPGPLTNNMYATVNSDGFVVKLDPSGNFMWSAEMGAQDNDYVYQLDVDASGNVHLVGTFLLNVDFDPGPGNYNINTSSRDIFLWKLSSTGTFIWAKSVGGFSSDWVANIAVDNGGNVYATGNFRGTADFDPGAGVYNLTGAGVGGNAFVLKLDISGNFVWAVAFTGNNNNSISETIGIALAPNSDIIVTGDFMGTIDFDPGPGTNTITAQGFDGFVMRMNASTGSPIWTNILNGPSEQVAWSTETDASGTIYVSGYYRGLSNFDPSVSVPNISGFGGFDIFLCSFDGFGNFGSVFTAGGSGNDIGYSLAVNNSGEVHMAGSYSVTAAFGPNLNLISGGNTDAFVIKFKNCSSLITTQPVNSGNVLIGATVQFGIVSSGTSFQWQENAGMGFANLSNNVQYSGVNTATLTVSNVTLFQNNYTYRCLVSSPSCSLASSIATLSIDNGMGLGELSNTGGITVYPNPTSNELQLHVPAALHRSTYSLSDQVGRLIRQGQLNGLATVIDLGDLPKGLYFLQLGNNGQKPVKVMKE